MLETISQAIQAIADFFGGIIEWISGLIEDLIQMAEYLGQAVTAFPGYFTWLPAEVLALLAILIGIIVIYKFLGRD